LICARGSAEPVKYSFNIASQAADVALVLLAQQSKTQLLYPFDAVRSAIANAVVGNYVLEDAVSLLLKGTGFEGKVNEVGVLMITKSENTVANAEVNIANKPKNSRSKRGLLAALVSLFSVTTVQSISADEDKVQSRIIEEVIVTATKRSISSQDVGAALSVVTESALEMAGDMDVDSLADMVPGLQIVGTGPGNNEVVMRGIGSLSATKLPGQSVSTVGYYMDETPMSAFTDLPEIGLYDVERIEVLRGPQGTLFGDGSMGGTIRVITNKPDSSQYAGNLVANFSDTKLGGGNQSYRGMINIPVVTDVLALRVVGGYKEDSGWIDAPDLDKEDINDSRVLNYRVAFRWTPTEELTIDLSQFHNDVDIDGQFSETTRGVMDPMAVQPLSGPLGQTGFEEIEYDLTTLTVQYDFGFARLVSSTSTFDFDNEKREDLTHTLPLLGAPGLTGQFHFSFQQEAITQELRLVSNSDGAFRWTVGGFYKNMERTWDQKVDFMFGPFPAFDLLLDNDYEAISTAVFAEAEYDLSDNVTAIVGGRYFDNQVEYLNRASFFGAPFDPTIPVNELDESKFSPKLQVKWQLTDDVLLYAGASEGFRAGGVNSVARDIDDLDVAGPGDTRLSVPKGYDSETIRAYEVGIKSNPTKTLQVNGSIYLNEWEDIHLNDSTSDGLWSFTQNAKKAEVKGAEIEVLAMPAPGLSLSFSGAYTDASIDEDVLDGVGNIIAAAGAEIPFVPKITLNASASYSFPLSNNFDGLFYASYSHRDENYSDIENTEGGKIGSYSMVNARFGIESNSWGVFLYADNLLDSEDATFKRDFRGSNVLILNRFVKPRTVGVELKVSF